MRRITLVPIALLLLIVFALAGCGGGGHHGTTTTPPQPPQRAAVCPHNQAAIGCAIKAQHGLRALPPTAAPTGPRFPDVSSYQGAVNWPAVIAWQKGHGWRPYAIFKMGEYTLDPYALRNAHELTRLAVAHAGYWFLRNTGCSHEQALIVWAAKYLGLKVVVLDSEVPEARGYVACLVGPLRAAGLIVVEYTAPGTNPDGSSHPGGLAGTWGAAYGPRAPCLPWGCNLLAWQMTDGRWGFVTPIPTLGSVDVSVDYGISKLGVPKPPPVDYHVNYKAMWSVERAVVLRYDGARKHPRRYAGYLKHVLEPQLAKLAAAVSAAAHRHKPPNWSHVVAGHGSLTRGERYQLLETRARGKQWVK